MSEDVVADQEVGPRLVPQLLRELGAEEALERGYALQLGRFGGAASRLDAKYGDPARDEVLEQVAVVRGQFDDLLRRVEAEAAGHVLGEALAVCEPTSGVRGKVRVVVGEDRLGALELAELDEEAAIADVSPQGVEGLHSI